MIYPIRPFKVYSGFFTFGGFMPPEEVDTLPNPKVKVKTLQKTEMGRKDASANRGTPVEKYRQDIGKFLFFFILKDYAILNMDHRGSSRFIFVLKCLATQKWYPFVQCIV